MKKFQFRLENLLVVWGKDKANVLNEVASLNATILSHEQAIEYEEKQIHHCDSDYVPSENANLVIASGKIANAIRDVKRFNVNIHQKTLNDLLDKRKTAYKKLAIIEEKIKVLNKMKDRDYSQFVKNRQKREDKDIDDLQIFKRSYGDEI